MEERQLPPTPPATRGGLAARWWLLLAYAILFTCLTLAWRYTPLHHWTQADALSQLGRDLLASPLGGAAVLGAYVLAVLLAMPVYVLITAGALVFGPWPGMAYALGGMVLGAWFTYGIGRLTGARLIERMADDRFGLLLRRLQRRGLWTVVLIRFLPIAPFLLVNMTAGAVRVRQRDFVLGTFLGLLPGTVMISLFTDRLAAAWRDPGTGTYVALGAFVVLLGAAWWFLRRRLSRLAA
ncbi:MAG: DedA family protein [Aquabacterium sp.]|nr:MAG: DedA family protein [Aquabacterium sp.]